MCSILHQGRPRKYDIVPKKPSPRPVVVEPIEIEEDSTESSFLTNSEEDMNQFEELFAAVMSACEGDRPLYPVFQLLPSRKVRIA